MMERCGIFLLCSLGDKVSGQVWMMKFHFAVQLSENRGLGEEVGKETPKG